jgi:hypothetical protein
MIVYVVLYTYPHQHSECEPECCGVTRSDVIGVTPEKDLTDIIITKHIADWYQDRRDYSVEEVEYTTTQSIVAEGL